MKTFFEKFGRGYRNVIRCALTEFSVYEANGHWTIFMDVFICDRAACYECNRAFFLYTIKLAMHTNVGKIPALIKKHKVVVLHFCVFFLLLRE